MERKDVALGKGGTKGACVALSAKKLNYEDRLALIEQQLVHMQKSITDIAKKLKEESKNAYEADDLNKHKLPVGMYCFGTSEKQVHPVVLRVEEEGYRVGAHVFGSLSAAAEAVSGVRRSGWTFWRTADGRTLKEAFK